MDLFHRIDDAEAIIRVKGGVFKQTEVYRRSDTWGTSSPNVTVVDISQDVPGMFVVGQPRWTGDVE